MEPKSIINVCEDCGKSVHFCADELCCEKCGKPIVSFGKKKLCYFCINEKAKYFDKIFCSNFGFA
jgi:predicted amidophosphoribosyltransferase